ncbi:hypothetical protein [Zobellella sp. DQSA1]|uniref:arsenate reductase/protein-tyrosine-phosphatase family protein n=1 Tax=Zobellella sp. DQSA1 TaxID=3342386 RepID=UPI0035BF98C8
MKILFLCTHNACRSILAEALCRHLADGRFDVASAGSAPAGRVHPRTLALLSERIRALLATEAEQLAPAQLQTLINRLGEVA